jgi:DNA-directed RNA polymerase specialized sigma24 family protein
MMGTLIHADGQSSPVPSLEDHGPDALLYREPRMGGADAGGDGKKRTLLEEYVAGGATLRKRLWAVAHRIVRHDEAAEDVVAAVAAGLAAGKTHGWTGTGNARSLLCVVTTNEALNARKSAGRRRERADFEEGVPDSGVPGPAPTPESEREFKQVHELVPEILAAWRAEVADDPIATKLLEDPSREPEIAEVVAARLGVTADVVRKARRRLEYARRKVLARFGYPVGKKAAAS